MPEKITLLLFDIDGTLLLTGGAGRIAFERIFQELYNVTGAWKGLVPDGKTDPLIIYELAEKNLPGPIAKQDYKEIHRRYLVYFEEELERVERFRVMPGVEKLIPQLARHAGFMLGVATGNFEGPAWLKLKRAGLRDYFQIGGFGCDADDRTGLVRAAVRRAEAEVRREISPESVVVIGDTIHDILAGRELGMKTVGVTTGSTDRKALEEAGADHVFDDLTDSPRFLNAVSH